MTVLGWDIGGSNIKAVRVEGGRLVAAQTQPFELRLDPGALVPRLQCLARELAPAVGGDAVAHAVTMTAELSRNFQSKREGVLFVLDAVAVAFPAAIVRFFTVDARFITLDEARHEPLRVAAANWMATACLVARSHRDVVLIDTGTTTTDIIPITAGVVAARGRTDPERLASGELVYTGAVRTPVEALAHDVDVLGRRYALAAEGFATSGDVHLWLGDLEPADYMCETADGRAATRPFAGDRLRRAVCADQELMGDAAVSALAISLAAAQVARVSRAIRRVRARHPSVRHAAVAGLGAFLAARAARDAGLAVRRLADDPDGAVDQHDALSRCAPAAAVALLWDGQTASPRGDARPSVPVLRAANTSQTSGTRGIDLVIKVGGGLLAHPAMWQWVIETVSVAAAGKAALIVPGGGPFADAVREVDRRVTVGDDAAHWMAILAMDQYAELLASQMPCAVLVTNLESARAALQAGQLPVLAPSRWLRDADPLPHSWDVTSDSIGAWIAGQAGAARFVVVKPPGASGPLVDPYFEQARPAGVAVTVVSADQRELLASSLAQSS
jgi:probable H4MPT-linked C1 transfer pathway protein